MNGLTPLPNFNRDRSEIALEYIDKLFVYFPKYDPIDIIDIINKNDFSEKENSEIRELFSEINSLLYDKYQYASKKSPTQYYGSLTELGRTVQASGGHVAYTKNQLNEIGNKKNREKISDEKLAFDISNAEFESTIGRKIRIRTWWMLILGFVFTVICSPYISRIFFPSNNEIQKKYEVEMKKSLDSIKSELLISKQQLKEFEIKLKSGASNNK